MITLKLLDHIFYQNNEYATVYQQFCSKQGSALWQLDCQNKKQIKNTISFANTLPIF